MKPAINTTILMLSILVLAGCRTPSGKPADKPLSKTQQESYLARAKPPQQFGFSIYAVDDGMAYAGHGRLHPNHFTSAEMIKENIPVISMRGRSPRNTLNALVDTSSPVSWMEFSVSQEFSAHFMGINQQVIPYRGSLNTGGIRAFAGVITQMRIDNLFIENMPFYIRMSSGSLGPLARGIRKPRVDAIVGYDNLRNFEYIQFDPYNNTISFSATTPYVPSESLPCEVVRIVKATKYGLAVEGEIDGQPTPMVLDFAGDFSLARGDVKVSTTREMRIGEMEFNDVPTLVLPVHAAPPRLGRKLLTPYLVTICNKKGVVYFEKLPSEE